MDAADVDRHDDCRMWQWPWAQIVPSAKQGKPIAST